MGAFITLHSLPLAYTFPNSESQTRDTHRNLENKNAHTRTHTRSAQCLPVYEHDSLPETLPL